MRSGTCWVIALKNAVLKLCVCLIIYPSISIFLMCMKYVREPLQQCLPTHSVIHITLLFSLNVQTRYGGHSAFYSRTLWSFFCGGGAGRGGICRSSKLTFYFHLIPRLRICGAVVPVDHVLSSLLRLFYFHLFWMVVDQILGLSKLAP